MHLQAGEEVSKNLFQMKAILYGDGGGFAENEKTGLQADSIAETEPQPDQVAQLAQEVYNNDVLQLLVSNIWRFEFEAKKDVSQIFNNLLRRQIGVRWPTVEHLAAKPDVLFTALKGLVARRLTQELEGTDARSLVQRYENPDVALNTGMILREMLRHEVLAKTLLYSDKCVFLFCKFSPCGAQLTQPTRRFYTFPDHIEKTTFGVSCDAFANFKETLTRHKPMVAEYLEKNYDRVRCLLLDFRKGTCSDVDMFSSSPCTRDCCIRQIT